MGFSLPILSFIDVGEDNWILASKALAGGGLMLLVLWGMFVALVFAVFMRPRQHPSQTQTQQQGPSSSASPITTKELQQSASLDPTVSPTEIKTKDSESSRSDESNVII